MRIAVAGLGYVGLAVGVLLAQRHEVVALDVDAGRVSLVNARRSPIEDPDIEEFLTSRQLDLRATTDPAEAYPGADFVVIATPTNYDPEADFFDTSTVEDVIADVERLLQVLLRLRDAGNSLIVIEHNLDVVKTADYIVDLGPEGGDEGGRVVACGTPEEIAADPASHTGEYLRPLLGPAVPPAKAKRAKKKA